MKSPDEIKKGLECCAMSSYRCEDDCPYREQCRNEQGGKAMNEDALALIQQLEAQVPRWISMEDRHPKYGEEVLICKKVGKYKMLAVGYLDEDGCFYTGEGWFAEVTHWMPLPEPPKEE